MPDLGSLSILCTMIICQDGSGMKLRFLDPFSLDLFSYIIDITILVLRKLKSKMVPSFQSLLLATKLSYGTELDPKTHDSLDQKEHNLFQKKLNTPDGKSLLIWV